MHDRKKIAEELRLIRKELGWIAKHVVTIDSIMSPKDAEPTQEPVDPAQLLIFTESDNL